MELFPDTCSRLDHSLNSTTSGHREDIVKNAFQLTPVDVLSSDFSFSNIGVYDLYTPLTHGVYKSYFSMCENGKHVVDRNRWGSGELLSHGDIAMGESHLMRKPQLHRRQRNEPVTCDSHWKSEPELYKSQTDEPVTDKSHWGSEPELCTSQENGPITKESRIWGEFEHEDYGENESHLSPDDHFVPEIHIHSTTSVADNKTSMPQTGNLIIENPLFQNQKAVFQNQEVVIPHHEASVVTAEASNALTEAPAILSEVETSIKTRVSGVAAFVDEILPSQDKERPVFQDETHSLQNHGLFSKSETHLFENMSWHNISGPHASTPSTVYTEPQSPCSYQELGAAAIHPLLAHYSARDTAEQLCELSNDAPVSQVIPQPFTSAHCNESVFSDMELSFLDPDDIIISKSQHVAEPHNVLSVSQDAIHETYNVLSNEACCVPSEAKQQHFTEYHNEGSYAFRNRTAAQNLHGDDSDQSQSYTSDSCDSVCTMTKNSEDASVDVPSSTSDAPYKRSTASAASSRQRKKSSAATSRHKSAPPSSSALPPCRVCGGNASGFHYGVNSCDACKGFFRRALKRRRNYACSGNRNCPIRGQRRISCAYCRYQRCLAVGMSRQAIKIGRYTSAMRAHNFKELRLHKTNVDSLELQDQEVDAILRDLVEAGKASLFSAEDYSPDEILRKQEACVQEYLSQKVILGSLENLPPEVREEFLKERGIDPDPCKEHLKRHAVNVEKYVRRYIRFGKGIPGFKELSLDDQANLLKTARMEIWFLAAYPGYNNTLQVTHFPNGKCEHYSTLSKVFGGMAHLYAVGDLAERLRRYRFAPEEMVVVKAICLMSTDRCPLEQPEKVEEIQWLLTRCLLRLFERRCPGKSRLLFTEAVEALVACRDMKDLSDRAARKDPLKQVYSKHKLLEEVILMCP